MNITNGLGRWSLICIGTLLFISAVLLSELQRLQQTSHPVPHISSFLQLPLSFESNQGQAADTVKYLSRGNGYQIYFTPSEIVFDLSYASAPTSNQRDHISLQFVGANTAPIIRGQEKMQSVSNYFIGNNPRFWHANVQHYAKVNYQNLYPAIDAVFYGNKQKFEYDMRVAPGGDPKSLRFKIIGSQPLYLDKNGSLIIVAQNGKSIKMEKPVIYQGDEKSKRYINGQFKLLGNQQFGFDIPTYDKSQPLIIDPILNYSSYLGGTGSAESGLAITADDSGAVYVTGSTNSLDFPSLNPYQPVNPGGQRTAFISKLDASGNLVYSTYLGGHGGMDQGFGIAVDSYKNAYVAGATNSIDFPLQNPFQAVKLGPNLNAFITKLNADGNGLIYSTYLGGTGFYNEAMSIAVDYTGRAYVTGFTNSLDFPLKNPFQAKNAGSDITAFVTKLSRRGNNLVYSTYLGGSGGNDRAAGIAVDDSGSAFVTGQTNSIDFPTQNPFQAQPKLTGAGLTGFVTKFNATGDALIYSTYLGGTGGNDSPNAIAVGSFSGKAYVTGFTNSKDFPTQNPYQATNKGTNFSAFISKLSYSGNSLNYSTYLGGTGGNDKSFGIALDTSENVYVTGQTNSLDFPLKNPIQAVNKSADLTTFITKLRSTGTSLSFSTYFGGSGGNEVGRSIVVDANDNIYVTGQTNSTDFPTLNPFQSMNKGINLTAYVAKLSP